MPGRAAAGQARHKRRSARPGREGTRAQRRCARSCCRSRGTLAAQQCVCGLGRRCSSSGKAPVCAEGAAEAQRGRLWLQPGQTCQHLPHGARLYGRRRKATSKGGGCGGRDSKGPGGGGGKGEGGERAGRGREEGERARRRSGAKGASGTRETPSGVQCACRGRERRKRKGKERKRGRGRERKREKEKKGQRCTKGEGFRFAPLFSFSH